jgi:GNAT superfamily N-acetyltransferase
MHVNYRTASADDHATVVQLLYELVLELGPAENAERLRSRLDDDIQVALASPSITVILAEVDGQPIGLGRVDVLTADPIFRLRDDHRCGYVDQMFVRPRYRSLGIGHELLGRCEQWLRERGIGHVLLHAAPRAQRFYEREGYLSNREMFKRL